LAGLLVELASDRPIDPHRAGDVDPRLMPVLKRALAKQRDDRFETAGAFAEALASAVSRPDDSELWPSEAPAATGGLQSDFIERVERELMEVTGPIARILVREAGKRAASEEQIVSHLAAGIPDPRSRDRFLRAFAGRRPKAPSPSAPPSPDLGSGAGLPMSPEALESVQTLLVSFIGPFGRVLVRQGSMRAASVSQFYDQLAVHIKHEKDREAFRRKFLEQFPSKS
jgi:serine/threonine-protein kinase